MNCDQLPQMSAARLLASLCSCIQFDGARFLVKYVRCSYTDTKFNLELYQNSSFSQESFKYQLDADRESDLKLNVIDLDQPFNPASYSYSVSSDAN